MRVEVGGNLQNSYRRDGSCIVPQFLSEPGRLAALDLLEQLDARDELAPTYEAQYEPDARGGRQRLRKVRRLIWNEPVAWSAILREHSKTQAVADELVGADAGIILHAAFLKPARIGSAVDFHQDQALWDNPYPDAISIWVALSPASVENGCVVGYPGSHRNGLLEHEPAAASYSHRYVDVERHGLTDQSHYELAPGDAVVLHRYLVHGSAPNRSEHDRRGIVLVVARHTLADFRSRDLFALADLASPAAVTR